VEAGYTGATSVSKTFTQNPATVMHDGKPVDVGLLRAIPYADSDEMERKYGAV
jgi:hypothetical protein